MTLEASTVEDRQIQIATLDAILALAEKLTGEQLSVRLNYENGEFVWITSSKNARWSGKEKF